MALNLLSASWWFSNHRSCARGHH